MQGRRRMMIAGKQKGDMKSFRKLIAYCKPYAGWIIIGLLCAAGAAVCTILGPNRIMDLVDIITAGMKSMGKLDMAEIKKAAIILLSIYVTGAVLHYVQQFIMATVTQKTTRNLRTDINVKLNKMPLSYFDRNSKGDILSRVTNDTDTISQTLGTTMATIVSSIVLLVGILIMMFYTNWLLALVTIGTSIFGFLFMSIVLKTSQKYFIAKQMLLGQMNGQIEEVYTNLNVVKSNNGIDNENIKFKKTNDGLYASNWKSQFLSGLMMPIMGLVGNLSYLLIFIVGVACVINNFTVVTLGTIISFTIYARLFSQPLSQFAQSMTAMQQASAAAKRVFELKDEQEMENEDHKNAVVSDIKGEVEFTNVKFSYLPEREIIKNFSAKFEAGNKIAIVGPTGAGKTTIVNLLMRFYEIDKGTITIDGVDTKTMKRETVHDMFDMILQDTWLFEGTVRENLVYNKENVSDEELQRAVDAVGLHHLIESLPNGYDTILDDKAQLSEGQKQQITIARAMIKDAPLLILDEATSNVDTRTELIIQHAMDELTKNRTSFVIAHRLSTIKNADVILVLKDGDIIEMGNHESLLEAKGFYADLYNSQFQTFE